MKTKKSNLFVILCVVMVVIAIFGFCIPLFYKAGDSSNGGDTSGTSDTFVELNNARYLAFGDSITYKGNPSYTEIVGETLGLKEYTNKGINGTTMANCTAYGTPMINRIGEASVGADIITIAYGTNDCSFSKALGDMSSTESSTYYGAYKKVILGLQRLCPNVQIMLIAPLQNLDYNQENETTKTNNQGKHLIEYVNAVKELGEYYNLPVLDLYHSGFNYSTNSSDGVHPNQDYISNNLAPQIAQFIKDNYKLK